MGYLICIIVFGLLYCLYAAISVHNQIESELDAIDEIEKSRRRCQKGSCMLTLGNFEKLVENIYKREIPVKDDKIAQTYRNQLRQELMEALCEDFNGTRTVDGIVLEIENEIEGAVFVELNVKIKGFDYDVEEAAQLYQEKIDKRSEKKTAKKKA